MNALPHPPTARDRFPALLPDPMSKLAQGEEGAEREGWTYRVEGVSGEAVRVVARSPEAGSITSWLVV